jgi:hypothetical protein
MNHDESAQGQSRPSVQANMFCGWIHSYPWPTAAQAAIEAKNKALFCAAGEPQCASLA